MSNADISIPCLAGVLNNVLQNPYICWNWQASWFVLHQGHVWGCNCAIKGKGKLFPLLRVMQQQPQWMYLDLCHFSRWHRAEHTRADLGSFCATEEQGFDQVQLLSPSPACCSLPTVKNPPSALKHLLPSSSPPSQIVVRVEIGQHTSLTHRRTRRLGT